MRNDKNYKHGHLPHSINVIEGGKFETWLGSIIQPGEPFYLAGNNKEQLAKLIDRAAAIGYEGQIKEAFVLEYGTETTPDLDIDQFKENTDNFTVVDVRNNSEVKQKKIFSNSIHIPLGELRKRLAEIPTNKPVVVHCAGGTRSAAASSLIQAQLNDNTKVYDLGAAIKTFD